MSDWPKCEQVDCAADAAARVFWPRRAPLYCCAEHTIKAQRIGQVIGTYIHAEQLKPEDVVLKFGSEPGE